MADPITRKDLETVVQRVIIENKETPVTITNSKDIAKPLIDEQKKNDIKALADRIKQQSIFLDIRDGLNSVADSIKDGFKGLGDSLKGKAAKGLTGLGLALGAIAGTILAPIIATGAFFGQIATELRLLDKVFFKGNIGKRIKGIFNPVRRFFNALDDLWTKGGTNKFLKGDTLKIFGKNAQKIGKFFGKIKKFISPITRMFGKVSSLLSPLTRFFSASGGKGFLSVFGKISSFAKVFGRLLGKLFLPITIIMGVFDAIKGFQKGFAEGGIIGGITEAITSVFDGLVGSLVRMLGSIVEWIFKLFGMESLGEKISGFFNSIIDGIMNAFRGLVDVVVGIFTFDGEKIMGGLTKIWDSIVNVFLSGWEVVKEVFNSIMNMDWVQDLKEKFNIGEKIKKIFAEISLWVADMFDWVPGFGDKAEEMKKSAKKTLNEIEKAEEARKLSKLEKTSTPITSGSGGGFVQSNTSNPITVNNINVSGPNYGTTVGAMNASMR